MPEEQENEPIIDPSLEPFATAVATMEPDAGPPRTALLGWSLQTMEAHAKANRPFVVVAPAPFESFASQHGLRFVAWDFNRISDKSTELFETLNTMGVQVAVPLYEETVEWAGALNARFRNDPRLFNRYYLFRDKPMMKRKAQMSGLRVGVFEEVDSREGVQRFLDRVNRAMLKIEGEIADPVHIKPLASAGSLGHRVIRTADDVNEIPDDSFPCLAESHLDGQEFSCEAFIHRGKVRFLNITEYIRLGYSNFVPASPRLASKRELIQGAIEQLIQAFGIEYGMIHPEFFINERGEISFGEVAARVPGGHIFDLIERAYGFSPYLAFSMCCDPETTDDELRELFPDEDDHKAYAGCLMVYPTKKRVEQLEVPEELSADPMFVKHDLIMPLTSKVPDREGFGNHYGTIYLQGDDCERMREVLKKYEKFDFYK